jgi:hypothetical protein
VPERYPLSWPASWRRTPAADRVRAHFGRTETRFNPALGRNDYAGKRSLSVADAIQRIALELERNGASTDNAIISTNVPTRLDGLPRSDRGEPADPGVAVYWTRKGKKESMAVDVYDRVADNLAAVAATLEAFRAIARHGGAQILERTFTGFAQLPAAIVTARPWRFVFAFREGEAVDIEKMDRRYRERARDLHPDVVTGDHDRMVELNQAREAARRELGA